MLNSEVGRVAQLAALLERLKAHDIALFEHQ